MPATLFATDVKSDWEALLRCLRREGTPRRVHRMELFFDKEIEEAIARKFGLVDDLNSADPTYPLARQVRVQRFLGFDYVKAPVVGAKLPRNSASVQDTASLARGTGRAFVDMHVGPITNWQQFEEYAWPDPAKLTTTALEWYTQNLPEGMCIIGGSLGHYAEHLSFLMGYETLCYALFDQRDLVEAIYQKIHALNLAQVRAMLQFDRVKALFPSDDMGFRSGTLISPEDLRTYVLPGHRASAKLAHDAGRLYLLHNCGQISAIMEDLIEDVKIDGKHSFEDTIETVIDFRKQYGSRVAALGGIDVDFLCRADEASIRQRVRTTLDACMDGGGYCLGTGNSVANYIPVDNYLTMVDESRKWGT